jgi:hypothetical protein
MLTVLFPRNRDAPTGGDSVAVAARSGGRSPLGHARAFEGFLRGIISLRKFVPKPAVVAPVALAEPAPAEAADLPSVIPGPDDVSAFSGSPRPGDESPEDREIREIRAQIENYRRRAMARREARRASRSTGAESPQRGGRRRRPRAIDGGEVGEVPPSVRGASKIHPEPGFEVDPSVARMLRRRHGQLPPLAEATSDPDSGDDAPLRPFPAWNTNPLFSSETSGS